MEYKIAKGSIQANGLKFGFLEAGPERGPLALCLHGFPDSAYTWRHLLPELAAAGYRAVAPFARGYAPTAVPADGAYQSGALVADAVALHEELGGDQDAVLIGHDWGTAAAYGAAVIAPERWRRVVTLAGPPLAATGDAFQRYEQLKRWFYLFLFQTPLAELVLDRLFIEGLWRDWSPESADIAADVSYAAECLAAPENATAAIEYYRALFDHSLHFERYAREQEAVAATGERPVLYLHGMEDGALGADIIAPAGDLNRVMAALPPGSHADLVAGAGHFPHLDRPGEVNRKILDWVSG
ncbi:alpha/beta fold hydrolase [Actinomadura rayongensis]|uniref:Alpha/beta fold hydrolase n=1 Tax=Actinomadura rayongensis TaxID=1429076 RepID=A0A6I4WKA5_9ACTN|nr:alpha/beta hydrolase [Actinomadura rayongensis]MXQ68116.1 alpha/beta fold hydrolase [Actinomadura rayongensis]